MILRHRSGSYHLRHLAIHISTELSVSESIQPTGDQPRAELVVLEGAEAADDPLAQLSDLVESLAITVAATVGIEVRQDHRLPLPRRPAHPDDLRDWARRQGPDHALSEPLCLGEGVLAEHV